MEAVTNDAFTREDDRAEELTCLEEELRRSVASCRRGRAAAVDGEGGNAEGSSVELVVGQEEPVRGLGRCGHDGGRSGEELGERGEAGRCGLAGVIVVVANDLRMIVDERR